MQKTNIEYLTHTWNPLAMRCTRVSAGCDNCWHLRMVNRMAGNSILKTEARRAYFGEAPWLNADELAAPLRLSKPARIGVQFMGDLFHEDITNEQIAAVFGVMAACPQHTFFVLTKRERMALWFQWIKNEGASFLCDWEYDKITAKCSATAKDKYLHEQYSLTKLFSACKQKWPLPNAWLGVSVEDQEHLHRAWTLLKIPAAKWFISLEPLLSEVDMDSKELLIDKRRFKSTIGNYLDLVIICGAETGPGARLCDPDWLRSIRDQCEAAGVPFFLKAINAKGDRELDGRRHEEMP